MPIIYQKFIYREDLQKNPNVLYIFGDNFSGIGKGGQAKEMRGEPNAVGIPTKVSYGPTDYCSDEWVDANTDYVKQVLIERFNRLADHLEHGGLVIFPTDGVGTGLADLPNQAPKFMETLNGYISFLFSQFPM